jgi:hypothetical protein
VTRRGIPGVLIGAALVSAAARAQTAAEARFQIEPWNAFAKEYNLATSRLNRGEWPLETLRAVQRKWRDLQKLPGWPPEKGCGD